jgi:CubicO group peptidase (beta-lactamase class C family)
MRRAWLSLLAIGSACSSGGASDSSGAIARVRDSLMPTVVITGEAPATVSIADRMAALNVPAVSVAVIDSGRIVWTEAWGTADVATGRPATTGTLFQAASISKPVAATAALQLVEEGKVDLDVPVNTYLRSWKIPGSSFTAGESVTLRRLLRHTAGLTVHGFPGYARSAEIPDAVAVLEGRGNTDPVQVDATPGSAWRYSGGGYTVVQVLLSDVTGQPFADLMRARVLEPAGMTSSTYEQPLPEARWAEAATAYRPDGQPVEEGWHVYPEQAAAGLWTTPTDLARWGLAILAAYDGKEGGVLAPGTARATLTSGMGRYGLGPGIGEDGKWFGHGGSNEGFRCQLVVFLDGRGAAVMTNGDRGHELIQQILATLASAYDWPDFRPEERTVAEVDAALLDALVGSYRVERLDLDATIERRDGRLYIAFPGFTSEILPESDSVFFARENGGRFRVIRDGGTVVALEHQGERAVRVGG